MVVVQRVLEDRVPKLLEKLLLKPSLVSAPPMEEGGLILVSNMTRFSSKVLIDRERMTH